MRKPANCRPLQPPRTGCPEGPRPKGLRLKGRCSARRWLIGFALALGLGLWPMVKGIAQDSGVGVGTGKAPPWLASQLPGAVPVGQGMLRFLGLSVYDAVLFAPITEARGQEILNSPFALTLRYRMRFTGASIAQTSIDEIKRLGRGSAEQHAAWLSQMLSIFPDVAREDQITGIHRPKQGALFFLNDRVLGQINDPEFSAAFFGIWLAPGTREPSLRAALLAGLNTPAASDGQSPPQRTAR